MTLIKNDYLAPRTELLLLAPHSAAKSFALKKSLVTQLRRLRQQCRDALMYQEANIINGILLRSFIQTRSPFYTILTKGEWVALSSACRKVNAVALAPGIERDDAMMGKGNKLYAQLNAIRARSARTGWERLGFERPDYE